MVVRELVHIIGFRINEGQLASVEARVRQLGGMMSFFTSLPIVLMGKSFLEASLNMDQLALSIETYSKNATEAANVTAELKTLAMNLPTVQIKDLNETVGNLLARGIPANELVDTFKMFAIVTGATGGNMKGLTKAYTDTLGKGKLAGQEFNQFINASVPIRKALLDYFGGKKTIANLMDMQKKGLITFEVLREALKGLTVESGQFATIMGKKANLLWGAWQKFLDQLYYLKAELGKKLEVPLKVVLSVMSKIIDTLHSLDGNWKRFIIIGLGVTAIVGPIILLYSLLKSFMGPLGYIMAAIGIISAIIDDIYVWVQGGDSVLSMLFGDYAQYEPIFKSLKDTFVNLFTDLKDLLSEVFGLLGRITVAITGLDDTASNTAGLKGFLVILKAIGDTLDAIIISTRTLIHMGTSVFRSKEENDAASDKIAKQASKNTWLSQFGSLYDWSKSLKETRLGAIFGGDLFETMNAIRGTGKYKGLPSPVPQYGLSPNAAAAFSGIGAAFLPTGMLSFNPNVELNINGVTDTNLIPTIKKTVQDSLENVARKIKTNMAEK
jgi:tape measure domain-containing protein